MISIGCDYKMRQVAIACAQEKWAISLTTPAAGRADELGDLRSWFESHVPMNTHLWIESAIQGHSNVQTTVKMAQTQGALMSIHDGPCTVVAPSSWKAGLPGLGGHASKEQVAEWLFYNHPDLHAHCDSQDEIDAMCLSLYGQSQMS